MARVLGFLIAAPIIFLVALVAASEFGGEVVELETYDPNGTKFATSLWVADLGGDAWLRAGDPESSWVLRLRENRQAKLTRNGEEVEVEAVFIDDYATQINREMRLKYGIADVIVSLTHDSDSVLAVRLLDPDA